MWMIWSLLNLKWILTKLNWERVRVCARERESERENSIDVIPVQMCANIERCWMCVHWFFVYFCHYVCVCVCVSFCNFILLKMFSIANGNRTRHWLPLMRLYNKIAASKQLKHKRAKFGIHFLCVLFGHCVKKKGWAREQSLNTCRAIWYHTNQYALHTLNAHFTHLFSVRVCCAYVHPQSRHRHVLLSERETERHPHKHTLHTYTHNRAVHTKTHPNKKSKSLFLPQ